MTFAISTFAASLFGIVALFWFKYRELRSGRVLLPDLRAKADGAALRLKAIMLNSRGEIEKLPPFLMALCRTGVHELALILAALARAGEAQAHRLADIVSHKHRFERREPRSEFLKQVSEHRNENTSLEHDGSSQ